jgi:DNA topoisomerase-1
MARGAAAGPRGAVGPVDTELTRRSGPVEATRHGAPGSRRADPQNQLQSETVSRLRRVSPTDPGFTRRRAGRGWVYLDVERRRITDHDVIDRIAHLAIPPAYTDVWICRYPNGHIQAVGTDDRGRRQYRYHPEWREQRDRAKHDRILFVARRLPAARERVAADLGVRGMPRERALATAFRLLELGFFRVGGEEYAEENHSYGLATLLREHVVVGREEVRFRYIAKSGKDRRIVIRDAAVRDSISLLKRRHGGGADLLAWREGGRWHDVTSTDINRYLHQVVGDGVTAKDFRTWHGTVLAAVNLAALPEVGASAAARKRAVNEMLRAVSEQLGNTPAVARKSYVDPRVVQRFHEGRTVASALRRIGADPVAWDAGAQARLEKAVVSLLAAEQAAARAEAVADKAESQARAARRTARLAGQRAQAAADDVVETTLAATA